MCLFNCLLWNFFSAAGIPPLCFHTMAIWCLCHVTMWLGWATISTVLILVCFWIEVTREILGDVQGQREALTIMWLTPDAGLLIHLIAVKQHIYLQLFYIPRICLQPLWLQGRECVFDSVPKDLCFCKIPFVSKVRGKNSSGLQSVLMEFLLVLAGASLLMLFPSWMFALLQHSTRDNSLTETETLYLLPNNL